MTATYCTGWDRTSPDEWCTLPPNRWRRWVIIMRFRKEMRGW